MSTYRRTKLEQYLSCCTKGKSKWIKGLNLNPETARRSHKQYPDVHSEKEFQNEIPFAQELKSEIDKLDILKLKSFCTAEETNQVSDKETHRVGAKLHHLCT